MKVILSTISSLTTTCLISIFAVSCGHSPGDSHSHDHEADLKEKVDETVSHDAHSHEGAIELSVEQAGSFGVVVESATPAEFNNTIHVSGRIEPAATDRMAVTARRSGILRLSPGITVGRHVNAGAAIGSISAKGLEGGDMNGAALTAVELAKRELDRVTPLFNEGLVTSQEYYEAQRAYKSALASVGTSSGGTGVETAPCTGVISDITVESGQYVAVGTRIATIARNTNLTLRADIPERYIAYIPAFSNANFRPDYSEDVFSIASLSGHRLSPGSVPPAQNGYISIYFTFSDNGRIVPGAFADVYLIADSRQNVISIPREGLVEMQGNKYAYVQLHDNLYEKRLVETGASDGERVEIISGIKPGEKVVTKGATVIRMAETSAIAPPGHTHNH